MLWGYPELFDEYQVEVKPVLDLVREEKERERQALRQSSPAQVIGHPYAPSEGGDEPENASGPTSSQMVRGHGGAVGTNSRATDVTQQVAPDAGSEQRPELNDQSSPCPEHVDIEERLRRATGELNELEEGPKKWKQDIEDGTRIEAGKEEKSK